MFGTILKIDYILNDKVMINLMYEFGVVHMLSIDPWITPIGMEGSPY